MNTENQMGDDSVHRLFQLADQVGSREDLINFISVLATHVDQLPPDESVNRSTELFLGAMSAWMKAQAELRARRMIAYIES